MPEGVGEANRGRVSVQQRPQFENLRRFWHHQLSPILIFSTPVLSGFDSHFAYEILMSLSSSHLNSCRQRCGNHHTWTFENFGLCNSKPPRKSVDNWTGMEHERKLTWKASARVLEMLVTYTEHTRRRLWFGREKNIV